MNVEQAAEICNCTAREIDRYRKLVLPRGSGKRRIVNLAEFTTPEVVAMAAGCTFQKWGVKKGADAFVATLALRSAKDRNWVAVFEDRKGLRVEATPFTLTVRGSIKGRIFDPNQYYEACDGI